LVLADPDEAKALVSGAGSVPAQRFDSHTELANSLKGMMQKGDRILFKASRSVELDKVVDQLLKECILQDFMVTL